MRKESEEVKRCRVIAKVMMTPSKTIFVNKERGRTASNEGALFIMNGVDKAEHSAESTVAKFW